MRFRSIHPFTRFILPCLCLALRMQAATYMPDKIAPAIRDKQQWQLPDAVRLSGQLGGRIDANETKRLALVDSEYLLDSYRNRPGKQTWDGEHIGKWLHAATLAWAGTGDPALRAKLDQTVSELAKCQLEDGYLGTYLPANYWTEWDVWAHKYNLIGLIAYARFTGDEKALVVCRRMADLLCRTFGERPGQKDLVRAGHHHGMAALCVLEPMAQLYRLTGETRYLEFCQYILRVSEQPHGPKIVSTLLTLKRVDKVGNGKAYEMLSCLNGILEMYRTTGDARLLEACENAWTDIRKNRLYVTGAASYGELFRDDYDLPNSHRVGETCVTVTWEQFNAQLLRLSGEARFAHELERVVLNQLLGAQSPDCSAWGYYVQLQGRKPFSSTLTGHCCLSSGPRGVALIPTFAVSTDGAGVVVNLYDEGVARLKLADGSPVTVNIDTKYPSDGQVRILVSPDTSKTFGVKLRVPAWSPNSPVLVNGVAQNGGVGADGYVLVNRTWKRGDVVELRMKLEPRLHIGDHMNAGKGVILYGPLVLAADEALLPDDVRQPALVSIPQRNVSALNFTAEPAPEKLKTWAHAQVFRITAGARQTSAKQQTVVSRTIRLRPFADAGSTGGQYQVWLPIAATGPTDGTANILPEGVGRKNGQSDQSSAITPFNDDDITTSSMIFSREPVRDQWFSVTLDRSISITRVEFAHSRTLKTGGWFNTSEGKPLVQVQRERDGTWVTVGTFADYPETTAIEGGPIGNDEVTASNSTAAGLAKVIAARTYTLNLNKPEQAVAVRVIGTPSNLNRPGGEGIVILDCAELRAFGR